MQIYGATQLHGAQQVSAPHTARSATPTSAAGTARINDELSISDAAQHLEQIRQMPDVRQDRVAAIRAQIASGTYETPDKIDVALNRLLDEIG